MVVVDSWRETIILCLIGGYQKFTYNISYLPFKSTARIKFCQGTLYYHISLLGANMKATVLILATSVKDTFFDGLLRHNFD